MKIITLLTLTTFMFAEPILTDIQNPKTNAEDLLFIESNNTKCNTQLQKTAEILLEMADAEQANSTIELDSNYNLFIKESDKAIKVCKYNKDIKEIQTNVILYYTLNYK